MHYSVFERKNLTNTKSISGGPALTHPSHLLVQDPLLSSGRDLTVNRCVTAQSVLEHKDEQRTPLRGVQRKESFISGDTLICNRGSLLEEDSGVQRTHMN